MGDSRDSEGPNVRRSQAILRIPVNYVDATLILHDGERSDVIFFVPPGETLTRHVVEGDGFVPVMRAAKVVIIARSAIACVGTPAAPAHDADEMPSEKQRVAIKLKSGTMLEGELRWPVVEGKQRTADFLNTSPTYVVLSAGAIDYLVFKAHVATVQEL